MRRIVNLDDVNENKKPDGSGRIQYPSWVFPYRQIHGRRNLELFMRNLEAWRMQTRIPHARKTGPIGLGIPSLYPQNHSKLSETGCPSREKEKVPNREASLDLYRFVSKGSKMTSKGCRYTSSICTRSTLFRHAEGVKKGGCRPDYKGV